MGVLYVMLILHAAHCYWPEVSGVAEVVTQLSERLAARGHEVHVASGRFGSVARRDAYNGVDIHRFDVRGNRHVGIRGESRRYREFLGSRNWDIVVLHCGQCWCTDVALEVFNPAGSPMIVVSHGLSALTNTVWRDYFEWYRRAVLRLDGMVVLAPNLEEAALFGHTHRLPTEVIPNGVDIGLWDSVGTANRRCPSSPLELLCVSNHNPMKGHAKLYGVFRSTARAVRNIRLRVVGRNYPAARMGLGRAGIMGGCWYSCQARYLRDRRFVLNPALTRQEVICAFKTSDIYLSTSTWEAYSLSILESMASSLPWVSFDTGSVSQLPGGIVVGSEAEMAEEVLKLAGSFRLRAELGEAGRSFVEGTHHWDRITDRYESFYRRVVRLRRKSTLAV